MIAITVTLAPIREADFADGNDRLTDAGIEQNCIGGWV